ncbi:hypothetical protein [uncultured Paludibaculum sp.]|uniref:hypothetical protein n=1 Tax=uncultured Paludibaculum sp. TaxID=1765020 RepID=UPI002AAB364C|nr:hypothetical protein [uncultured Paludibaculum sp.]
MRCLHCGRRLSLLRKFSDGEFCSAEHRQVFQQQQSDLALARLIESQNRITQPPKAKPSPKPVVRPKAAAEGEPQVPEARPIAEWFKAVGRRVVSVPNNAPFDPQQSSSIPRVALGVWQQGFDEALAVRLTVGSSPIARQWQPTVLNPLFRLGIHLPIDANPVPPCFALGAAEQCPLRLAVCPTGVAQQRAPAVIALNVEGVCRIPALLFGTVAPDRPAVVEPEPPRFADALMPLAYPVPELSRLSTVSAPSPLQPHMERHSKLTATSGTGRMAEEEATPLPLAETLLPLAMPVAGSGPEITIAEPVLNLPLEADAWSAGWASNTPRNAGRMAVAVLRDESAMEPMAAPQVLALSAVISNMETSALVAEAGPASPKSQAKPALAGMPESRRSARLKVKAMAAAVGLGPAASNVEPLGGSAVPGKPGGPGRQIRTGLILREEQCALVVSGAQDAPKPVVWDSLAVEILDVACAPCVPAGHLWPEVPEPVVIPPEMEAESFPYEDEEIIVTRVVRPLIDDAAALSGLADEPPATQVTSCDVPDEPLAALEAALATHSPRVEPEPTESPVAAQQSEAHELELAALNAAVEALTTDEEPAAEPVPAMAVLQAAVEAEQLTDPGDAVPSYEIEPDALPPATSEVTTEPAVESTPLMTESPVAAQAEQLTGSWTADEAQQAEADLPVEQSVERDLPMCDQLRLYAGRGETGAGCVTHASSADDLGVWVDALARDPMRPGSRLVVDHADGSGPRRSQAERQLKKPSGLLRFDTQKLPGRRFWAHAPSDLKWVALALPLILGLVVYSFKASPPKTEAGRSVASKSPSVIGSELNSIQKVILDRAAIKLYDDFRGGLGSWQGAEGWAKTWKYGEASFLEPGQLALYSPTVNMRDYTIQFLGQIERRSLNWVFRARDNRNYYAMRIVITRTGPLPQASVVRYAVIDGKEAGAKTLPLPFPVHSDTLYLVKMEVRGDSFTTYIQSQVVDNFSDTRLEGGGVGFFSPKGDKSYLRWVEVTHQYDVLGRLCAFLAPYNVQAEGRKTE